MSNRLKEALSPYLLQHSENPVDWYPWGDEALSRARDLDRPIFLSIGYAACHWCHVMAHECFENATIAALLNDHFVPIKVDREERPDLDRIYQTICQMVTGQGGWPLSVFLQPDLKPFYVGTYFPPRSHYGRPGFADVLRSLHNAYSTRRQEIAEIADEWTTVLGHAAAPPKASPAEETSLANVGSDAARTLMQSYDASAGGFGDAPKFPNASLLDFLLRASHMDRVAECRDAVLHTLRAMARGGIYDHLGGGFHRYSTDAHWRIPHFEKMLYDQALLVPVYLAALQISGDKELERVVRETLGYVLREMTSAEQAFFSTQDADSDDGEGRYFVWTPAQVQDAAPEDSDLLCRYFDITPAGNFEDGTTVLHVAIEPRELASTLNEDETTVRQRLDAGRQALLRARARRTPPARDDKVLTSWNGLMISAFARAGRILDDKRYTEAARAAADFLLATMKTDAGGLLHRYRDGKAGITGYLEDYAYLTAGLVDLYEATFDGRYLRDATRLCRTLLARFYDPGRGFSLAATGSQALIAAPLDFHDSALPSAGAIATMTLLRLAPFQEDSDFQDAADTVLALYEGAMARSPWGMAAFLCARLLAEHGVTEVTIAADSNAPETREWTAQLARRYLPNLVMALVENAPSTAPIFSGRAAKHGKPTIYVCKNRVCSALATSFEAVASLLT